MFCVVGINIGVLSVAIEADLPPAVAHGCPRERRESLDTCLPTGGLDEFFCCSFIFIFMSSSFLFCSVLFLIKADEGRWCHYRWRYRRSTRPTTYHTHLSSLLA